MISVQLSFRAQVLLRAAAFVWLAAGLGRAAPAPDGGAAPEIGLPYVTNYEPSDYQGHTQVWSAVEDSRSVLYFGNLDCLLEYDGARWDKLPVPGGSFVRGIAVDPDDVLWIGGVNELGYARLSPTGERTFVSLRGALPPEAHSPGEIWRVYPSEGGALFQSNSWILYWANDHFVTLHLPAPGPWQLLKVADEFWATSNQHGWYRLKLGPRTLELAPIPQAAAFPQSALSFVLNDPDGRRAVVGSAKLGLLTWDGTTLTRLPTDDDAEFTAARAYRGARLADGRMAFSTLENGVFIFDHSGHLLTHLNQANGLTDNTVGNVMADRHGGLWLCLDRGLAHVDARPWLTWFGPASGAPGAYFDAPFRLDGKLYVASTDGLATFQPGPPGAGAHLVPVPEIRTYLNFAQAVDGGILCGGESGLIYWKDGVAAPIPDDAQNVFGATRSLHQPNRWFVMADGDLRTYRFDGGKWVSEGKIPELSTVRSAYEDPSGAWWFGTPANGAFHVTFPHANDAGPGTPVIEPIGEAEGIPPHHGWVRIIPNHGQPVMICELGIYRYDTVIKRFERTDEFGPEFADGQLALRSLTEATDGLWLAAKTPGQVEVVAPVTVGHAVRGQWHPISLPELAKLDDVAALHYEPAAVAGENVLWISGHGGLLRLDLDGWKEATAPVPAEVLLRRAENTSGETLPLSGHWDLPHAMRGVHLVFATPGLARDPALRYETVLDSGSDRTTSIDAIPERNFSALASGDYTLRVRAKGNSGEWTLPLILTFSVSPPWWFGIWAWVAYVIFGFLLVIVLVRERTRELTRRAEVLEGIIATRTEELRKNNLELAHLHKLELDEKIEARLSESKARLELLRYQLNPHFLMNAFTALRSLIFAKPEDAATMVGKLADFCRMALTRSDADGGSVDDEAQLIETYLGTEKARWRNELIVNMTVDPQIVAHRIPPFLLQPLVENAIKYGGRTSPLPLRVQITLSALGTDGLRIEVSNTGTWLEANAPERLDSTGIGLDNLRQRLVRYYPKAHDLRFSSANGWVRVVLDLTAPPRDPFRPPEKAS